MVDGFVETLNGTAKTSVEFATGQKVLIMEPGTGRWNSRPGSDCSNLRLSPVSVGQVGMIKQHWSNFL